MSIPEHYDTRRGIRRWYSFGNFVYGDCTVAGVFHLIMVHAVTASSTWKKLLYRLGFRAPHNRFVVSEYAAFLATLGERPSGTAGVDPNAFLPWMKAQGRIKEWSLIPMVVDWDTTIRQAIYEWDGCLIGLSLTKRAYDMGLAHEPWSLHPGETPDSGLAHAVAGVAYATDIGLVTWGQMKEMTPAFANACVWSVWGFTS